MLEGKMKSVCGWPHIVGW